MKSFALSGTLRTEVGKKTANELKKQGSVPCVLYGTENPVHFSIPIPDLKKAVYTADTFSYNLTVDGKTYLAVMQDQQFDPVSEIMIHADFLLIKEDQPITVSLPVRYVGSPVGVLVKGGVLKKAVRRLNVKGFLKDIPNELVIDIANLDLHQSIRNKDLNFTGVEIMGGASNLVVAVQPTRTSTDVVEGAPGATPAATPAAATATKAAPAKTAAKK